MIRRTQIARSTTPIKARRSKPRRVSVMRDKKYLAWLKTTQCIACESTRRDLAALGFSAANGFKLQSKCTLIDPAHGPVNGMRSKGDDCEAIPLCRLHHTEQHAIGWPAFEARYGVECAKEAATHYVAFLLVSGRIPA